MADAATTLTPAGAGAADGNGPAKHQLSSSRASILSGLPAPLRRLLRGLVFSSRMAAILVVALIVTLRVEDVRPLQLLRLEVVDTMQRLYPRTLTSGAIAIVDIDEPSLISHGQWPWSRVAIADLVTRLRDAGALVIGFDILFAEPDRLSPTTFGANAGDLPDAIRGILMTMPDSDLVMAETIAQAPVVLGRAMTNDAAVVARTGSMRSTPVAAFGGEPLPFLFSYASLLPNLAALEDAASGLGTFTLSPEPDGVVRRVPAVMRVGDTVYPSLAIEMMRVALGASFFEIHTNPQGAGIQSIGVGDYDIPTDGAGRIWLHNAPYTPSLYISAGDVLDGTVAPDAFDGKYVLIGTSATGLRDLRVTPLSQSIPGVELHAHLIDAVLAGDVLSQPPYALGVELAVTVLGCLLLIWALPRIGAGPSLAILFLMLAIAWGISILAFLEYGHIIDATLATVAAALVFGLLAYANYAREERRRRDIRSAFGQYLSPELVHQLEAHPERLRLGGEMRELTFLFTDLEGFTSLVERSAPDEIVHVLNDYLDGMCRIVMNHGGTIDKIVGDAVHGMFGAPVEIPDHATSAVRAAIEIDAFSEQFRRDLKARGVALGVTRIGVNTGRVVVGNFGGARRLDYTAHGDAINTAARLEAANKMLGTRICVSQSTMAQCKDIAFRPMGALQLRGKSVATNVFEPLIDVTDGAYQEHYAAAFALMGAGDPQALPALERLAETAPDDPLVALHCRRLRAGEAGVRIGAAS